MLFPTPHCFMKHARVTAPFPPLGRLRGGSDLSQGADVSTPDGAGNTPLHYAAKNGHTELVKWLAGGQGVVVERRNASGQTAYAVASSHDIRQFLLPLQLK
ncbi:unnamed protein product, partial [Choristocarpus tenellus]